jgi:hypothetical protein
MTNDSVERPVVVAALVALLAVLVIEGAAVAAIFGDPQVPYAASRSLINYVVERGH